MRRTPVLLAPTGALPKAVPVATPSVRALLGYTRRVLHLPDGHTLAVFSFGGSALANWIFLIDTRTLASKRVPMPNNDIPSHGAALAKDGNLYFMPYGNGRAYRYRVAEDRFEPLETGLPSTEYTWDAFGAANGCVYFGTYPSATFGEFDPMSGKCRLFRQVRPDAKYVTDLRDSPGGRVGLRAWGPGEHRLEFDPATGEFARAGEVQQEASPLLPPAPKGDSGWDRPVRARGRVFAVSKPSGRLFEIEETGNVRKAKLLGSSGHPAEPWFLEATVTEVVGISQFGALFRFDLRTERLQRGELDNLAPGGNPVMFLEAVSPECVIGANYSQQNLFDVNPKTGAAKLSSGMVAKVTGEPMCAVGFRGRAYLGIYVWSILSVYDPKRPIAPGKNPKEIADLHKRYRQTRPRAAVTDGKRVYISSDGDYSVLGGALAIVDPKTNRVEVLHHLIRDQNLPTLAWDSKNRLLWGGTDRWGQMRSHPPTQPSALLYAFDPDTKRVAATLAPWPGADVVNVLGVSPEGFVIASSGQEIALIDGAKREVLYKGSSPIGVPWRVRFGSDGICYALMEGLLYRWNLEKNSLVPVAETPGCMFLAETEPGIWALASQTTVFRLAGLPRAHRASPERRP